MPASLGIFAGSSADHHDTGRDLFAELPSPRARPRRGWRVPRSPGGWPVLFAGWIDNRTELAAKLSLRSDDPAVLYGAAVERWADGADREIVGDYAALVCLPDDTVRIARAPYSTQGIFWHSDGETLIVSSITRPIFAAGVRKRLRLEAIDALLSMQGWEGDEAQFEEVHQLRAGRIAVLGRSAKPERLVDWYDPCAVPPINLKSDRDYVAAANEMLSDAVAKALAPSAKPAMSLSGGLDSSLVCAEALAQLPPGRRLSAITFGPVKEWQGLVLAHKFGDDRPWVAEFAKLHPNLDVTYIDNAGLRYDDRAEELFLASDHGAPSRIVSSLHHKVMETAAAEGHDWLLTAWMGNDTFSATPEWAMPELFRSGHWSELWRMANARVADWRPVWRRCFAHGVMPNLPPRTRSFLRNLVHGADQSLGANPFLRKDGRLAHLDRDAALANGVMAFGDFRSREEYWRFVYGAAGGTPELAAGAEQAFGIRQRDVLRYRPLIEFCYGVPTDQFVRDGETRWLARRMAEGRLPEAQRTNRLYGEQNADWYERTAPQLPRLRKEIEQLAQHPEMCEVIDVEQALAAIDNFPAEPTLDVVTRNKFALYVPALAYMGRYLDFVSGRNRSG